MTLFPSPAEPVSWGTVLRVALLTALLAAVIVIGFWLLGVALGTWVISRGMQP